MEFEILIILACVPLYVVNSFCDKHISTKKNNYFSNIYNCIKFLMVSICFLPMFLIDESPKFTYGVILCGIGCGILYASSKIIILKGYENSSIAFINLCHCAGMLIPCIVGHFLWDEKLTILSVFGIFMTIVSIVLLKSSPQSDNKIKISGIIMGIFVFLTSGGIMVCQKIMGIYFNGESVSAYNFYSFLLSFLMMSSFVCFSPNKPENKENIKKKCLLLCAIGSAISLCIINFVMTTLAGSIPSIILFPLYNGLCIVSVCIGSAIIFKEKLTKKNIIGLILGLVGLCLVNL